MESESENGAPIPEQHSTINNTGAKIHQALAHSLAALLPTKFTYPYSVSVLKGRDDAGAFF
jgi:hypothetical protein